MLTRAVKAKTTTTTTLTWSIADVFEELLLLPFQSLLESSYFSWSLIECHINPLLRDNCFTFWRKLSFIRISHHNAHTTSCGTATLQDDLL